MSGNLAALLYLASGVLFILALRGLSSPATSRRGNLFGIIGMAIAIVTTLLYRLPSGLSAWIFVVVGIAIGGGIGAWRARTVQMTAMPQLVASFHALVGLAAVFVAAGALYAPQAFGIGTPGDIHGQSLVEMSIGVAIGAITFTGSVIAFLKLDGRMSGKPILLPQRHAINIALAASARRAHRVVRDQPEPAAVLADRHRLFRHRPFDHRADRRRRHAGRRLDAEFLFGMGSGWHRLHARQSGAHHHRRACRLLRRDPLLHHVQGDEPLLHLGNPRRFRRRNSGRRQAISRRGR